MSSDKICQECNQEFNDFEERWRKPCNSKHFQNNFYKWTSGKFNEKIVMQSKKYIYDWCKPCNSKHFRDDFDNEQVEITQSISLRKIVKGGFGTIYKAKWIDGSIMRWDFENQRWLRGGQDDVALKKFDNNFARLNEEFGILK
ncbi:hypothetical protein Glove_91g93 [Diversispora epigaea]|uniref:Protein kinase domain-containing protein n=1 Tax=Diversispora epigaea TaxID=1348612 RepID=A0A397J9W1_9GLOM|nr:hypothetical protein Glove_91g93 [Diversispora epigaea]